MQVEKKNQMHGFTPTHFQIMLFPTAPAAKKNTVNPHDTFHALTSQERLKHVHSMEELIGSTSVALDIEKSIIAFAQGDIVLYRKKIRQILYNLSINKDHIINTYHVWEIAFIGSKLLFEGTRRCEDMKIEKRKVSDVVKFADDTDAMLDARIKEDGLQANETKCRNRRCRAKYDNPNIIKYRRQTRAGDEGATAFFECMHCHKRWRG